MRIFIKIDFKILREDILSKFIFGQNTLMLILNFPCRRSPITLGFQLGNKYFLENLKESN